MMITQNTSASSTVQASNDCQKSRGASWKATVASSRASESEKMALCATTNISIAASWTAQFRVGCCPHTGKRLAPNMTSGVRSAHEYVKINSAGTSCVSDTGAPTRRL